MCPGDDSGSQPRNPLAFDVVLIGAGAAGLSAALTLARARRRILLLDAGMPRNAPSPEAHGLFTRDGMSSEALLRIGRDQLRAYPSVEMRSNTVVDVQPIHTGFEVSPSSGAPEQARRLLLAFGVVDDLPDVHGMRELWGKSVLHCPYCHGWEVRDEPLAAYGRGDEAMDLACLLLGWSRDVVLCTDGPSDLADDQCAELSRHGVQVREEPIARLAGTLGVLDRIVFASGHSLARRAMFLQPRQRLRSDVAQRLGCHTTELGLIRTDEWGETSVPGVFAAGDAVTPIQQLSRAAASGTTAAIGLNRSLVAEDLR